jgi:CRISPR/Cas system-associated exonuclease Cas4 (RecB family)
VGPGRPPKYLLADGTEVPGVTTILRDTENKDALVAWAVKQALAGKDHNETRETAANIGKATHDSLHAMVGGQDVIACSENVIEVNEAIVKFMPWTELRQPKIALAETPMVSEQYRFGGTPDFIGHVSGAYPSSLGGHTDLDGKLVVIDYKTSNTGPYASWLLQLGAYALLYKETHGVMPAAGCAVHVSARRKAYRETWIHEGRLNYCAEVFLDFHRARRRRIEVDSWLKKEQYGKTTNPG